MFLIHLLNTNYISHTRQTHLTANMGRGRLVKKSGRGKVKGYKSTRQRGRPKKPIAGKKLSDISESRRAQLFHDPLILHIDIKHMEILNNMIGKISYKSMNVVGTDVTPDKVNPTVPLWKDEYQNVREQLQVILKKHLHMNSNSKKKINFVKFATGFNNNMKNEAMSETERDVLERSDPNIFLNTFKHFDMRPFIVEKSAPSGKLLDCKPHNDMYPCKAKRYKAYSFVLLLKSSSPVIFNFDMDRTWKFNHKVKIEGGQGLVFDAHIYHWVSQHGRKRKRTYRNYINISFYAE